MKPIRVAIVVISDGVAAGQREDTSGRAIEAWADAHDYLITGRHVVADRHDDVVDLLTRVADDTETDVCLTTGGTGLTASDVTPEATRAVLEREAPGIAEALRAEGAQHTSYSWLSRGVAGTRRRTLIINLPGSESGVRDGLVVLDRMLAHAVQLIRGIDTGKH